MMLELHLLRFEASRLLPPYRLLVFLVCESCVAQSVSGLVGESTTGGMMMRHEDEALEALEA